MNRFINYYKKIFSQEYMDRTISGGIKSQLTLATRYHCYGADYLFYYRDALFPSNCMDTRNGEKDFGWCTITLSIPVTK